MKNSVVNAMYPRRYIKKTKNPCLEREKGSRNSTYNYVGSFLYSFAVYWILTSCQVLFSVPGKGE